MAVLPESSCPREKSLPRKLILLPALAIAFLAVVVLFERLFTDASLLGMDNRIISPFLYHLPENEPPRMMNTGAKDINGFIMPETLMSLERWKAGEIPLWNPNEIMGQPLHASMGFVSFYPTSFLYFVMDPLRAYAVALALHLVFLGLGAYLLFKHDGLSATPALFGGVLAMFCGFVTARFHMACIIWVAAWYPWILLASKRLIDRPTYRGAAWLALSIGLSLLGGFPQVAMFMLYAAAAAFLVGWFRRSRRFKTMVLAFVAALSGGLLSAVLMLPGAEFLSESTRGTHLPEESFSTRTLDPVAAIGAVLPHFFGDIVQEVDPHNPTVRALSDFPTHSLTTPGNQNVFTENCLFMGCIPLALIAIALVQGMKKNNRFHIALAAVAIGIAFGVPLISDAARHLPGAADGLPKRALWIASFSMAWLAASGLASMMRSSRQGPLFTLVIAGSSFVVLGALSWMPFETWVLSDASADDLYWFRQSVRPDLWNAGFAGVMLLLSAWLLKRAAPVLAAIVLIFGGTVEVAHFARATHPPQALESQFASTPVIEWLKQKGADSDCRIVSFYNSQALPGSLAQIFGIKSINGYTAMTDRRSAELFDALDPEMLRVDKRVVGAIRDVALLRSPLLDLFNVRFVACSLPGHNILEPRIEEFPNIELCYVNKDEVLALYERKTVLPPAFMVKEVKCVPDNETRIELLTSSSFKPIDLAVVEKASHSRTAEELTQGEVDYNRVSPERIELQVNSPGPGFVVISETHFPGWEASVDGKAVPLIQTNHSLMGVAVPAGSHDVEIVYRPASFYWGAALSIVGLLICVALFLLSALKKEKWGWEGTF